MMLNQKLNKQTLQRLLNSSKKHKKSQSAVNSAEKENYTATQAFDSPLKYMET